MNTFKSKIVLADAEAGLNPTSEELAKIVLHRIGLMPRKQGATDKMYRTLLELYERAKAAYREKKPEKAVMTVEEMGYFAGITRQTMYDYLGRWLTLGLITKASYIYESRVIIGYKLQGSTLETAFDKAMQRIQQHMDMTGKYVQELQRLVKNEKISQTQKMRMIDTQENVQVIQAEHEPQLNAEIPSTDAPEPTTE